MSPLRVLPIRSRSERKAFLSLPRRLYQGDPKWVPPLASEEAALLGFRSHPFHEVNQAQCFLAMRGNRAVGRIAAIHNREHNRHQQDSVGFFGFFECEDDLPAAQELFATASAWLSARGLTQIRGPMNPSINYTAGLLVEGHDREPAFLTPYNHAYYARLLEGCGFGKAHDLWALRTERSQFEPLLARAESLIARITRRFSLKIRTWTSTPTTHELADMLGVINQSLTSHWGYVPVTQRELHRAVAGLRWLIVPELVVGVEIDGRLASVILALPDYNPRLRQINGRLFPFNIFRLLLGKRKLPRFRVIATNVLPQYHRLGLGVVMVNALIQRALAWGSQEIEFSWIAESNQASYGTLENAGAIRDRTFRVYERAIATPSSVLPASA